MHGLKNARESAFFPTVSSVTGNKHRSRVSDRKSIHTKGETVFGISKPEYQRFMEDFRGGPVVQNPCFQSRQHTGSILGWGTKIPHAVRCGQKIFMESQSMLIWALCLNGPIWDILN